ncbi:endolytic transglycosylase MltG [Marinicella sp. S1101]|uniref:endolytic transglycosylase MltG n=1 Tax=Marinicella marina TaxID=2996016 RepID=UPI0022609F2A|nr:endolytic transglycosylase MltG [Marinicella marina]MCX7555028.1 endolytic transglycosylase MltG [Marinicella marina]MDJ1141308.1 endolytic transglycosylase MltG [Marinicella marina]
MKKLFLSFVCLILLLGIVSGSYLYYQYNQFLIQPVFNQLPVVLEIKKGTGFSQFVQMVHAKGGQGSELNWKIMARFNQLDNSIKAGEFEITASMSPRELVTYIDENNVKTYSITIVEGQQWREIKRTFLTSSLKSTLHDLSDAELKIKLGIETGNLEGQFLPETYQFVKDDTDLDVLSRAHEALKVVLEEAWEQRANDLALKTPYELLTLASIIEKETAKSSERNVISGVFNRRLKKGMRLQTDPTVIYGVGSAYAGDITSAHLRTDTPYNTYTRAGLPPTPIAAASAASIRAAAHPNLGKELYFVANNKGGHKFSEDYEQHKKAVADYLKGLRLND